MNTKSLLTRIAVPVLGLGLLGGLGATLATSASASTMASVQQQATYTATAHEANVADTTNVSGNATQLDPQFGPVWAHDNLERKLTATNNGDGTWAVRIDSQGSFSAFANPLDGNAYTGSGSVKGYINYTVTSDHAPSGTSLAAQLPDTMRSGQIVAQWFGVDPSAVQGVVNGINYSFDYNPVSVPGDVAFPSGTNGISYGQGPNGLHYIQIG